MDSFLVFFLVMLLGLPLVTLVHELGHAAPALLFTKRYVAVEVGPSPWLWQRQLGRLHLKISAPARLFGWTPGYCWCDLTEITTLKKLLVHIGGPVASLVMAFLFSGVSDGLPERWLRWQPVTDLLALFALLSVIFSLIPIRYPPWWGPYAGLNSDGRNIMNRLRELQSERQG